MDAKDDLPSDSDSDTPIYVGQCPTASEHNRDDVSNGDVGSLVAPVLDQIHDGERNAPPSIEKQSDDPPLLDLALRSDDGLSEMPYESGWHEDMLDCTQESGCSWVDEYSDEEILVGHEAKDAAPASRIECPQENINFTGEAENLCKPIASCIESKNSDTFAGQEQHHSTNRDTDRINGVDNEVDRAMCGSWRILEQTPQMIVGNGNEGVLNSPQKAHTSILQDHTVASTSSLADLAKDAPWEKKTEKISLNVAKTRKNAFTKTSPCQAAEGRDMHRTNSQVRKSYPLRHRKRFSSREDNQKSKSKSHAKKRIVTHCKESKGTCNERSSMLTSLRKSPREGTVRDGTEVNETENLLCAQKISPKNNTEIDEINRIDGTNSPVSHRNSQRNSEEMSEYEKKKRSSSNELIEIDKEGGTNLPDLQNTFSMKINEVNEIQEEAVADLPVLQRTSPRKGNKVDESKQIMRRKRTKTKEMRNEKVLLVSGENLASNHKQVESDIMLGKKRTPSKDRDRITDILDAGLDPLNGSDVEDCSQICSSQIYTGAPIFSDSRTKVRKESRSGAISSSKVPEEVSVMAEEMQESVVDSSTERVPNPISGLNQGGKNESKQGQPHSTDLDQASIGSTFADQDVRETARRQRGRKRSCLKQSEATWMEKKADDAGSHSEVKMLKRTRKISRSCKSSRRKGSERNNDNEPDTPVLQSSRVSNETSFEGSELFMQPANTSEGTLVEEADGPTPPEKRPIRRARSSRSRGLGKKSASDLINILKAASASALERVCESKENQESVPTEQKVTPRKGKGASARMTKAGVSRKRKRRSHSGGRDDGPEPSDSNKAAEEAIASQEQENRLINVTSEGGTDPSQKEHCNMQRLDSGSHDDYSEDDEEELMNPVLTPDSKLKDLPPAFNVNDVVWAQDPRDKSKWPAVVIDVAGENVSRRVYSVFKTNQSKEQFFEVKSSRYLKPYNCKEKEDYLEKGKGLAEFHIAVDKANDFIMKIGLEKVKSYEDYFKPSDAYVDSPPPSPVYTSPLSPPLIVGHSSPELYPSHSPKSNQDVVDVDHDDDEEEEEAGKRLNDSLNSVKSSRCNGASKEITRLKRKWQRKEKRLLEQMKSLQTKEYLFGIQQGKILSERHQWFISNNQNDKGRLLRGSFGALVNEKKQFEMVDYLRDILTNERNLLSSPSYVIQVAVPEALNLAYQKTNKVGKEEAEQLIHMDGQQVIRDLDLS